MISITICIEQSGKKKALLLGDSPSISETTNFIKRFYTDENLDIVYHRLKIKDFKEIIKTVLEKIKKN